MEENAGGFDSRVRRPVLLDREVLMNDLNALPGNKILDRILEQENPRKMVQSLSSGDFFWLVKGIGEEDCLPLLELASVDQWQYLLDLEIWRKDRLDVTYTWVWMKRLQQADSRRLVRWLFGEGEALGSYHFFSSIEVVVTSKKDEVYDLPEGFFTLDGIFHIKIIDSEYRETIETIIREMAEADFNRYQAFLSGLAGVLHAEMEEEIHRLRNVRLAEHGFLPSEEAVSVYALLEPEALGVEKKLALTDILLDDEVRAIIPISPLHNAGTKNRLMEAVLKTKDPLFLDRIRLEFAGLCNQIMSAEGLLVPEFDVLIRTCRKAASYLNLALERLCGREVSKAEQILRGHSLVELFRVGFGLALKMKWEAERWLKESWFHGQGLDAGFWGEPWGGILAGMLERRPQLYAGLKGEEYRDFEWLSELGECLKVLRRLMVLDGLMARVAESYPIDEGLMRSSEITFRPLLFNLWSRLLLGLEPSFSGLSVEQAKRFFERLREGTKRPPYQMDEFEETFVKDFMSYAFDADPEAASILGDTLSLIWQEFSEEYEWVSLRDLDSRYSKFISIMPSHEVALQ